MQGFSFFSDCTYFGGSEKPDLFYSLPGAGIYATFQFFRGDYTTEYINFLNINEFFQGD